MQKSSLKTPKLHDRNEPLSRLIHHKVGRAKVGAYQVEYNGFKQIYQFISRYIDRTNQQVEMLLLTLTDYKGSALSPEVLHEAYKRLEEAIRYSLRIGDVVAGYSSTQFLVILMDTTIDNGKMVAERVITEFRKSWTLPGVQLHYDLEEMSHSLIV